ncbi:MAG: arsenite methyltransferase [Methanomassiliicoccales archaeon]|nr:arsenite methyltransferase [Methanomassiliicoccales archaeon]
MPGKKSDEKVKAAVTKHYSKMAKKSKSCCESEPRGSELVKIYTAEELAVLPKEAKDSNCACGNPVAIAELEPGQVVLDLGSGAGVDVFLAARNVGPKGKVIGVDMTDAMLEKANKLAKRMGFDNVEFRKGEIENLPVVGDSVDVIISNCVINLVTDKERVFREAYRVLRPGGKLAISDRVLVKDLPDEAREDLDLWSVCVSGAVMEGEYLSKIRKAGFVKVKVTDRRTYSEQEARSFVKTGVEERKKRRRTLDEETAVQAFLAVANDRIVAFKPAK